MRAIEKIIGKKFERGMVPTGEQICEKQLFNLADRIEKVKVNEEEIAKYLPNKTSSSESYRSNLTGS